MKATALFCLTVLIGILLFGCAENTKDRTGVWGYTPEQIEEWKEAAENGDAEAIFDGKSLDGWSAVPELNDQNFEALIDISWQVNQRSKL